MGQVTIGELAEDLVPYTEKGNKIVNVAIVPRKMVEDIITMCRSIHGSFIAQNLADYAETLLNEFEKEEAGVEK